MTVDQIYCVLIIVVFTAIVSLTWFFAALSNQKPQDYFTPPQIFPAFDNEQKTIEAIIKALESCRQDFDQSCREYCVKPEEMAKMPLAKAVIEEYDAARRILARNFNISQPPLFGSVIDVRA